jgi:hypothetical protein
MKITIQEQPLEEEPEDGVIFYTGISVLVLVIIINYIFYS